MMMTMSSFYMSHTYDDDDDDDDEHFFHEPYI